MNRLALDNDLISDFDRHVDVYLQAKKRSEGWSSFKSFKTQTTEQYGRFFNNDIDYSELMKVAEDLFNKGKIKSNINAVLIDEEKQDIKAVLEEKFNVKPNKKVG